MTALESYRDLEVWRKSIEWVENIYPASRNFAPEEKFGLTAQLRRAAVSVPSNIAEAAARTSTGEYLQFLSIASGSLAEAETQLIPANRLEMLKQEALEEMLPEADAIGRMLTGSKRSLQSKR